MRVSVIGAGIGGLTAAVALQRDGHEVTVYEAAPEIAPVGAGIWLAPNGLASLRWIDPSLAEEVIAAGRLMREFLAVNAAGRTLSRVVGDDFADRYRHPHTLAISRPRLHAVLHAALEPGTVVLGRRSTRVTEVDPVVRAHFDDGSHADADLLIGADGIHSVVRTGLFGAMALRYSGQTCWRGLTPTRLGGHWADRGTELWADEPGLRAGFSQTADDEVYFYVTALAEPGRHDTPGRAKAELLQRVSSFPAIVRQIVDATAPERLIRSDLFDLPPLKSYVRGRIALLGDAAHATTPNLGQGANQAIEDAVVVADCLTGVDPDGAVDALHRYERRRIRKATFVVNTSWRMNQLVNMRWRWARRARDVVMASVPGAVTDRQFRRIYDVDVLSH